MIVCLWTCFTLRSRKMLCEKKEFWEAWYGQHRIVQRNIIPIQGAIIKSYIESNKKNFETVMVQKYYSSKKCLTPMLQIPPTYNTYYYSNSNFYRELSKRNQGEPPYVGMMMGEELQKLWQNMDFVKSLLGMDDLDTGACHP